MLPIALRKHVVVAILAGLIASASGLAQDAQVDLNMRAGLQALQQGRAQDAVQAFTRVTRLRPLSPRVR